MSTLTSTPTSPLPSAPARAARSASAPWIARTAGRAARAEWIKLRTLRSTWITLALTALVVVGFGVLAALMSSGQAQPAGGGPGGPGVSDPVGTVLAGANFAVLVVAVFGAVVGAREYSTGMIRTTLAAVPRRLPVLWGKVTGFVGLLAPVMVTAVLAAFFVGMRVLEAGGGATLAFGDTGVARAVLGTAGYLVAIGVIGLALGVLVRSTAGAIGTVIGAVLFVPTLATALLPDSWDAVLKYLPSNAGQSFTALSPSGDLLGSTAGALVVGAWVVLAVAAAAVALVRRDA